MADAVLGSASPQQPMADPTNAPDQKRARNLRIATSLSSRLLHLDVRRVVRLLTWTSPYMGHLEADQGEKSFHERKLLLLASSRQ
jgi:hypothetical protein